MNRMIDLTNVSKIYVRGTESIRAVDDLSLSLSEGEYVSIVGPSGSGKSTLLNLIGAVDNPTEGKVSISGTETTYFTERELARLRNSTIGFVFQQFFLVPTLTSLENILLPTLFSNNNGYGNGERAEELLSLVGLNDRGNHRPSELSGGEMQRVAIARALINRPKLILADEPTGNLDSKNADAIMKILADLNQDGLTVVLVTHNTEYADYSRKCIHLRDGKIVDEVVSK